MKRNLVHVLAFVMILSLLTGCAGSATTAATTAATTKAAATSAPATSAGTTAAKSGAVTRPEGYPAKAIDFIVPVAAGAAVDLPSRVLAEVLELGPKPLVVVNKPGATQTLGTLEAKSAAADGHTILAAANGSFMIQPAILKLNYTIDDFRHLALMTPGDPMVLVVTPNSPYKTYADLEKKIKSGATLSYSAGNPGGIGNLAGGSWLKAIGGTNNVKFVPYNGSAECVAALLGGHIDFLVIDNSETINRVQDKSFVALGMFSDNRTEALPDVPTLKELGVNNMAFYGYKWITVRKDTPEPIVKWIKQQLDIATTSEKYQAYIKKTYGAPVKQISEEELTKLVKDNLAANTPIVQDLGLVKK